MLTNIYGLSAIITVPVIFLKYVNYIGITVTYSLLPKPIQNYLNKKKTIAKQKFYV